MHTTLCFIATPLVLVQILCVTDEFVITIV